MTCKFNFVTRGLILGRKCLVNENYNGIRTVREAEIHTKGRKDSLKGLKLK